MKVIRSLEFRHGSREELLPGISPDFPYIASRAELDKYAGNLAPWHWHREVELFYMESGALEYSTPKGTMTFPQGSGGLVNSNVLHMTKPYGGSDQTVQLLHIFDASFIGGQKGSRIEHKYILPLTSAPQIEILPLFPDDPGHKGILLDIHRAFAIPGEEYAYEIRLRDALAEIWCRLFQLFHQQVEGAGQKDAMDEKLKLMLIYIHENYTGKISVKDIAASAYVSERACYRAFNQRLKVTPVEYLKKYRLQEACDMLANGGESLTAVGQNCGLGSSSYFGKVFKEVMGCTPLAYRCKWQDSDRPRRDGDIGLG